MYKTKIFLFLPIVTIWLSACAHSKTAQNTSPTASPAAPSVAEATHISKYGPNALPLSKNPNLEYFQHNKAADYWALAPYYIPQETKAGCSDATFAMVLNAARKDMPLTSADELVTFKSLAEKYSDDRYGNAMLGKTSGSSFDRSVVSWRNLVAVLKTATAKLNIKNPNTNIEFVPISESDREAKRKAFHQALVANEKTANDFLIVCYMQGLLTGDPEGMIAHVVAISAYDKKKHLVLLMDPDREWYEPYWAPENKLFDAMADRRTDSESPGWVSFRVR